MLKIVRWSRVDIRQQTEEASVAAFHKDCLRRVMQTRSVRSWNYADLSNAHYADRLTPPAKESEYPREEPQAIVAEIEGEQALVDANRKLISGCEEEIQATFARIWGEDEPAPAEVDA